jgi:hypothetical protein
MYTRFASLGMAVVIATMLFELSAVSPRWYKGNTHVHTELCGHADSTPEAVTRWYHDRGYNFLILSEHNLFIDPATVKLPENARKDFILIPGEEVTGNKVVHSTAMNSRALVDWTFDSARKSEIIQNHVEGAKAAGGELILNHPNFHYAVTAEDIRPVKGLYLFELYNGHPDVNNFGNGENPGTEEMWDTLLSSGMALYGVSSDDAHEFKRLHPNASNPGRGWVMVRSRELSGDAITAAMLRGDFYASSGVYLSEVSAGKRRYAVSVDESATREAIQSEYLFGKKIEDDKGLEEGFAIDFIGPEGKVLYATTGLEAAFRVPKDVSYVRCKVTFTTAVRGIWRQYFAWTQPVFNDNRLAEAYLAWERHAAE